ncbi:MAG: radical SAM protein [Bacteroidota bacterium]
MAQSDNKKYKLLLINPKQKYVNFYAQTELARILRKKKFMIPLSLPLIAALTPSHFDISIVDEEMESIPDGDLPDIVGITTLASTARRTYEICDFYRSKGVPVVVGGPYVSFLPDEALQHATSVISGEAEGIWQQCLADFESGELKPLYRNSEYCSYKTSPAPRWDLVDTHNIFQLGVQVSRGCPYKCEFCVVTKMFGHKMRYRELDDVMKELESLPLRRVFFIDDNFTVNKKYIRELCERIIPLDFSWACMASIEIADDRELLDLMARAGCFNILIGFESLNPESLAETHKKHNHSATGYNEAVRKIHEAGIHITASFAVGFDNDTLDEFDNILEFTTATGLSYLNMNLLGAPPGSELFYRLEEEGRWFNIPADYRSGLFPCIHYMNVSQKDLFMKYIDTAEAAYSWKVVSEKIPLLFGNGKFLRPYGGEQLSVGIRFRFIRILFGELLFTLNKYKRRALWRTIQLMAQNKLAKDKGFSYLLSMMSYNRHIKSIRNNMAEYLGIIDKYDKGPWAEMTEQERRTG